MSNVLYAIDIKRVITNSIIGLVFGLLLTFVPVSMLVSIIIAIIGLLMIFTNGYRLYMDMSSDKDSSSDTLITVIGVLLGFILLCFSNIVINVIVAIYLLGEPIFKLIKAKWDKNLILDQIPKMVLGVILLISGVSTFNLLFKILGIIVIVGSLLYFGINYYLYKKSGVKVIK